MITRSRSVATALGVAGLLLVTGCSAPADPVARERSSVVFDTFRSARTDVFISSDALLTTVKQPPTLISIPELGVSDMPVEPRGLEANGNMSLPVSPFRAGWYEFGAAPNSPAGATVLASHVDSLAEGKGPFAALRTAQPGAEITVVDTTGTVHLYVIVSVEKISKEVVPWDRFFSLAGDPRLVLITCGGAFDAAAGSYEDNYIVTAEKVT